MVPVGDHPILEIILKKLAREGITRVTLSVGYLSELIRAYFATERPGLETLALDYVDEVAPTGTAGALRLIEGLDETFLMMNGDVLTTMPMDRLVAHHRDRGAALTIATHPRDVKVDLGVLETDDGDRVTAYIEKPTLSYRVSMGVYVLEPRVLRHVPEGRHFDFPDLVQALLAAGEAVVSYPNEDLWLDIGRHDDYEEAQALLDRNREAFGLE
jgi:NDP-sugar pyrophosphorylase family protein